MAEEKGEYNLDALKPLIEASGLSQREILPRIAVGIFETASVAGCKISCEKCSGGCITCSPGRSRPAARWSEQVSQNM